MIGVWYFATWIAAVLAHPLVFGKLSRRRRAQIVIGLFITCLAASALIVTDWSFRHDGLDSLAPGALLVVVVLLLHSLVRGLRWGPDAVDHSWWYGLWVFTLAMVWIAVAVFSLFTFPVVAVAHSQDDHSAKVRVRGAAWTSDRIVTTVSWTPSWAPLLEREVITWAEKPKWDFANSKEVRVEPVPGARAFAVFHEGEALDRVYY